MENGGVYGYRNIILDLKDLGERCRKNRGHRLMKTEGTRAQCGYKHRKGYNRCKSAHVASYYLNREL